MITKNPKEISLMRYAGNILKNLFIELENIIKPGVTTNQLDEYCKKYIQDNGAYPSFLNYNGFPKSICASVNDQVVHGIPSNRVLVEGDIVSIDLGACYKGYHADAARTYPVGKVCEEKLRLIEICKQSFFEGIKNLKAGQKVGIISNAIQKFVESNGYSVVKELVGHGIGKNLHELPNVPNYGNENDGPVLLENTCIAIEPMINQKRPEILLENDDWGIITKDGSMSAHYENTLLITKSGVELLTL